MLNEQAQERASRRMNGGYRVLLSQQEKNYEEVLSTVIHARCHRQRQRQGNAVQAVKVREQVAGGRQVRTAGTRQIEWSVILAVATGSNAAKIAAFAGARDQHAQYTRNERRVIVRPN